jgi:hypothetical protein
MDPDLCPHAGFIIAQSSGALGDHRVESGCCQTCGGWYLRTTWRNGQVEFMALSVHQRATITAIGYRMIAA